jgi:RNA polymerase sigma factor (sigma-70 family)
MAATVGYVLAQLQRWTSPRLGELSDAVLLERFRQKRDESAFAALMARYGGMVLRCCRHVLGDAHEAEDAFQATFLILARKAHAIRQPAALPGYLHSIARRVALKARTRNAVCPSGTALVEKLQDAHSDPLMQLTAREVLDILDEEVARLPAAQRSAVLLCCLEGHTREEAAMILGCAPGSLKGHLERGRRRLQVRLQRRGIALPAALALLAVSHRQAASALLLNSAVKAALHGGIGNTASTLANSVLRTMLWGKLACVMTVVLTVALAASTTVAVIYRTPTAEVPEDKKPEVPAAPKEAGAGKPQVRTDAFGDPLPDGAIRRLGTLRFRHGGGTICNLLLTPDGKTLVSNSYYGSRTVCVWELATGKLLHQLPGTFEHKNIALSADGKVVAVGQKEAIVLWDLASGREVRRLAQPDASGFAFSPDGKTLAAAGNNSNILFWDLTTGKKTAKWKHDSNSVTELAFTPDGKTLISGQHFGSKIALWDIASGKKRQELDAKGGDIFSFALSPDGAILATGSRQGGIPLWDIKSGKLIRKLQAKGRKECTAVAFSPDGKTLAAVEREDDKDIVSFWDVASGKELPRPKGDIHAFWNIVFAPDGKTLITGWSSAIGFWDLATGKEIGPAASCPPLAFNVTASPDGQMLAFCEENIRLWDISRGREVGALPGGSESAMSLAFSPDGKSLAAGTIYNTISLWDLTSRKRIRTLKGDEKNDGMAFGHFSSIAFAPDGKTFASSGHDGIVRLWEAASGKELRRLPMKDHPEDFVTSESVAFSPDGKTLAASARGGSDCSKVRLWNVTTGKPLTRLNVHLNDPADKGPPNSLSLPHGPINQPKILYSPNGWMLAMNRWQKTIPVWEAATGQQRLLLKGHEDSTTCVAFAPDSRTLASASWDNTIRLWDLESGRELRKLTGHRGKANSLAFSADGKILVSAGDDTTILFWDVADVTHRKSSLAASLSERQSQALWEDLANDDADKAYAAMVRMAADGQTTMAALKERLHPIRPADPERLARLLKELDSDEFAVRELASGELEKLGDVIEPTVRQTLSRPGLSLELRQRLEALAKSLDEISGARLRQVRAIEVLEMLGTPEARDLLKTIAEGASAARLTEQAKAALERLRERSKANRSG